MKSHREYSRFNTWTIKIQQWHMRFIFHHRALWYCKLCRWQCPIFKQEKYWGSFEKVSSNLCQWFTENELKANARKWNLLISSGENIHVNTGTSQIKNSDCERLLGIDIDCTVTFKSHINQICSKAREQIKVLARIVPFLNKRKRKLLMNAFFKYQFSYCPLSWMFHSRTLSSMINRLH